jgi:hypothetical protein
MKLRLILVSVLLVLEHTLCDESCTCGLVDGSYMFCYSFYSWTSVNNYTSANYIDAINSKEMIIRPKRPLTLTNELDIVAVLDLAFNQSTQYFYYVKFFNLNGIDIQFVWDDRNESYDKYTNRAFW